MCSLDLFKYWRLKLQHMMFSCSISGLKMDGGLLFEKLNLSKVEKVITCYPIRMTREARIGIKVKRARKHFYLIIISTSSLPWYILHAAGTYKMPKADPKRRIS